MKYLTKPFALTAAMTFALATMGASLAHAAEEAAAAPEAKPDNELTFNAALTSDYRYRGISQTRLQPALQGGADWVNNPTGLYLGAWASTIKWIDDAGGDSRLELDLYGGKRGEIVKDVSYDVGFLAYVYQSNGLNPSANTRELYGQIGYGAFSAKYSHAISNLFGFADSKRSGYLDLAYNQDVYEGYTLNLHVGHQKVKNTSAASYTDWKVGVTKDYGIATVALAYIDTNSKAYIGPFGKDLGKAGLVLTVSKTF